MKGVIKMSGYVCLSEDNERIKELIARIEDTRSNYIIDMAYDYIYHWCDNMEDCYDGNAYDFSYASWGIGAKCIIEYLENLLSNQED